MSRGLTERETDLEVTRLLERWREGDEKAVDALLPLVYDDLRVLAVKYLRRERPDHTLQATELVHETYLRLARIAQFQAQDRHHFFTVAARAMRRILVDHARRYLADKRTTARRRVALDEHELPAFDRPEDIVQLHEALEVLVTRQPRPAQLIELRFFAGLSEGDAAEVLGVSRATVSRDWRFAKLWLLDYLHS